MLTRIAWLTVCLLLSLGVTVAGWPWLLGQDAVGPRQPAPAAARPTLTLAPTAPPRAPTPQPEAKGAAPGRDPAGLSPLQQQMYLSVQRAADWLARVNRPDGRFVYGFLPATSTIMEGDHYLRQAGAAFALARAGRYTGDERQIARARQAVLTLLGDTTPAAEDPQVRHTTLPSAVVNRLAAAGLLVLAISELPAPEKDLLEPSEQLCNYIRRQQRPDGSLCYADNPSDPQAAGQDADGINYYPGEALYGLMCSQARRPAAWKTEVVRKALAYYLPWWRAHKNMAFVPWQTAAYTEAYLATKEQAFADAVCEMNDWLCGLQYERIDPQHPLWIGGFRSWADGKPVEAAPQVGSACYAESLAAACRVARQTADLPHYRRYSEALERCLQFLTTLQFTESNTQHFAAWYRPRLLGAFHASDQDGNLRIDYTQHALSALVQYLTYVAPR